MKKVITLAIIILLFFIINTPVFADDIVPITPTVVTPTPTPVDYQLPYPGLLPDSPLYKLKTLRDKIISFLISDPLKRAQFDLLQSDKRLAASWMLSMEKPSKNQLISDTLSKGDNYFSEGIDQLNLSKKQGLDITDLTHSFYLSSLKHSEVIQSMEKTSSQSLKPILDQEEKRVQQFTNQVSNIVLKK